MITIVFIANMMPLPGNMGGKGIEKMLKALWFERLKETNSNLTARETIQGSPGPSHQWLMLQGWECDVSLSLSGWVDPGKHFCL